LTLLRKKARMAHSGASGADAMPEQLAVDRGVARPRPSKLKGAQQK
jgi:hypothetical protein